jgi:hypothetical protein
MNKNRYTNYNNLLIINSILKMEINKMNKENSIILITKMDFIKKDSQLKIMIIIKMIFLLKLNLHLIPILENLYKKISLPELFLIQIISSNNNNISSPSTKLQ